MALMKKFASYCGAACTVLMLAMPAQAQFKPIKFTEYDLPNGLHVILHEDHSAPVVATVVHYRVGARDENPSRTGFAHFFEHLMFESTTDIPRASIDKYVQEAGGELNAYTSFDETVYHFALPSNQLDLALWIESQRMRGLNVDSIGVATQRGVVKEERKMRYDNAPYGTWMETAFRNLYKGGIYSWTPIGSAQHIDSAAISEFRSFYNKFYQPNNATLVISGDINPAEARKSVERYFGAFPKAPAISRESNTVGDFTKEYRQTIEDNKAQLPGLFIAYRGPKKGDPDSYAMEMLSDILANGESSRLYRRIVDNEQIGVQASVSPFDLQYGGAVMLIAIAAPGKNVDDIEKSINNEIERVKADGVSDKEFQKAKNIIEAKFVQGKKGAMEKALALSQYYTYAGNTGMINTEIDQYMKVKKEDLQRVAQKYLQGDKRVVLTYLPKSQSK